MFKFRSTYFSLKNPALQDSYRFLVRIANLFRNYLLCVFLSYLPVLLRVRLLAYLISEHVAIVSRRPLLTVSVILFQLFSSLVCPANQLFSDICPFFLSSLDILLLLLIRPLLLLPFRACYQSHFPFPVVLFFFSRQ